MDFVKLAYGYLPLVWAANLAHYLRLGLQEGGRIIPVSLATFGSSGANLPVWIAHPAVVAFLQGSNFNYRHRVINLAGAKNRSTNLCRLWWSTTGALFYLVLAFGV